MNLKKLTQAVFEGLPPEYLWAAVDEDGDCFVFGAIPRELDGYGWGCEYGALSNYIGENFNTTDWQNSLIERLDVPTADKPESITDVARSIEAARVAEKVAGVTNFADLALEDPAGSLAAEYEAAMPYPDGDPRYFETSDVVNNPAHYTTGGIECIDAMQAMLSRDEFIGYLRGNIFKYQWRYKHKNGVEDLRKADWYAQRLIKVEDEK